METAPPDADRQPRDWRRSWITPVVLGLSYGLVARLAFGIDALSDIFGVMTIAFIYLVPLAIGILTILWGKAEPGWIDALLIPWIPTLLTIGSALLLLWEGLICIVVWLPLALACASVGGLIGKAARSVGRRGTVAFAAALLPVVFAPVENQFEDPVETRVVHDQITIEASAAAVWREIREVRPIDERELGESLAYRIGFPRPIEARLEGDGVGSVRYARFEGGVTFVERVTEWEENESLAFTIDASAVPSTTFDQHVAVGGRYFDVLSGRYEIEVVGPDRVVLHLTSDQRLGTRFNGYTQLWTDRFMSDIQATILAVVKARAEAAS